MNSMKSEIIFDTVTRVGHMPSTYVDEKLWRRLESMVNPTLFAVWNRVNDD